jgi:hypothetical protein
MRNSKKTLQIRGLAQLVQCRRRDHAAKGARHAIALVYTPFLFRNTTAVYPWLGKPGSNLITDMADDAIKYMNDLNAAAARD